MQKIYAEMKFNPLAGCLPMLLQMPIFIALFQVLREMGDRIGEGTYSFYNLVPNLVTTPSQAFGEGFGTFVPYLSSHDYLCWCHLPSDGSSAVGNRRHASRIRRS